jgi:hypothetical protein
MKLIQSEGEISFVPFNIITVTQEINRLEKKMPIAKMKDKFLDRIAK